MLKFCTECGKGLPKGARACDSCGLLLPIAEVENRPLDPIQERAMVDEIFKKLVVDKQFQEGITGDRKFRWHLAWRTFLLFFAVFGLFTGGGIWQAKQQLNDITTAQLKALNQSTSNRITEANVRIDNLIAQQFAEPRVSNTVERVAATKAADILQRGVQPKLDEVNKLLEDVLRPPKIRMAGTPSVSHGRPGYLVQLVIQSAENKLLRDFTVHFELVGSKAGKILKIESDEYTGIAVTKLGTAATVAISPKSIVNVALSVLVSDDSNGTSLVVSSPLMDGKRTIPINP